MTDSAFGFLDELLIEELNLPYEFNQWTDDLSFPFIVGEYSESPGLFEDGMEETTFILTATTNDGFITLEKIKNKIKQRLGNEGVTSILSDGSGIFIGYDGAFGVPTNEPGLFRMQINLKIKIWKVD